MDPNLLAKQIAAGDAIAFERLFDAYRDRLCRYVSAYIKSWESAEDVVGELFLALWRHRERLAEVRDLNAYLYTTARRDALDFLRHERIARQWESRQGDAARRGEHQVAPQAERRLLAEEVSAAVLLAADSLPDRQRDILLRRWNNQSYAAIAAALGISLKTVENHVSRAIAQLRKALPQFLD